MRGVSKTATLNHLHLSNGSDAVLITTSCIWDDQKMYINRMAEKKHAASTRQNDGQLCHWLHMCPHVFGYG